MVETRRTVLKFSASFVAAAVAPAGVFAKADYQPLLDDFAGGSETLTSGLLLDIPEKIEDGAFVMVSVSVTGGRAQRITILAPANPMPVVATFSLSTIVIPTLTTRVRLAGNQTVVAAARLDDGRVVYDARTVSVAVGGCGG